MSVECRRLDKLEEAIVRTDNIQGTGTYVILVRARTCVIFSSLIPLKHSCPIPINLLKSFFALLSNYGIFSCI
jgi:hypothetical protein